MRVLIVGSGGREHALAWSLSASPLLTKLWVAPGNPGTAQVAENVSLDALDIEGLTLFARGNGVDLVVPGPEAPLVAGLADALVAAGVIRRVKDVVRILGTGEIKSKLNLVVWSASAGAVKAIEAAGGTVVQERIAAEAKAAARVEKRNAAKGKAPAAKAPKGDANKISARTTRTAARTAK